MVTEGRDSQKKGAEPTESLTLKKRLSLALVSLHPFQYLFNEAKDGASCLGLKQGYNNTHVKRVPHAWHMAHAH